MAGQVARGVVERVVQGGGAEGLDLAEGAQDAVAVGGEGHEAPVLVVEAGQRDLVLRLQARPGSGVTAICALVVFSAPVMLPLASTSSEQARGQGLRLREVLEALGPAVLEDAELRLAQVRHRPALAVHGRGGEDDEVGAGWRSAGPAPACAAAAGRRQQGDGGRAVRSARERPSQTSI